MNVKELSSLVSGKILGDENILINAAAKVEEAKSGEISFIANQNYLKYLETTKSSAVVLNNKIDLTKFTNLPKALILVDDPYVSFVLILEKIQKPISILDDGINQSAKISASAKIGKNCKIGANVFIGENVLIGDGAQIFPNVVIERDVVIDCNAIIYSNAVIRFNSKIGKNVILNSGCIIGSDGFGWAQKKDGSYQKIPQLGNVILEDDVSIGANSCVDRATMGQTIIKRGTKIDNLVQIGHNAIIGEDTVVAGTTGIAGSTKVGNQVKIGGAVGIAGHLNIPDNTIIGGGSVVLHSIEKGNEIYSGSMNLTLMQNQRIEIILRKLPELYKNILELEKKVSELEKKSESSEGK